ncbi:MAG: hypothetical protein IH609_05410 [Dehalococcoidia bacterium]|nr:hypothetical protein [Dehalococcoidia bacterium]
MRVGIGVLVAAALIGVLPSFARAQDPGMPSDARVELREGPGGEIQVVVRWNPSANPEADYEVWRRTPWDVSYQVAEPYADVPASARLADGSYEFVDPEPFSNPDRPCYMVSATLGEPPQRSTLPGCIPTLPGGMAALAVTALPGPYRDSWYITGTGFAPGAYIELQELTCASVPCPGKDLSMAGHVEAAIDGRFSVFIALPEGASQGTRRIVAFERGWLPSQLVVAPSVEVEAGHPGAPSGHPISTRTGEPDVDRVLDVLASRDPLQFADLLRFRELPTLDGTSIERGLPTVTCGNGDGLVGEPPQGEPVAERLNALVSGFFGLRTYAVFRIAHAAGEWHAFEQATYAIVLGFAQDGYHPRGAVLAVSDAGIVGVGQVCGAVPPYYLRNVDSFVLAPVTTPLAPATGTGASPQSRGSNRDYLAAGIAMLAASALLCLETARRRR